MKLAGFWDFDAEIQRIALQLKDVAAQLKGE